ncbi:MAG: hypothetical protein LBV27_01110, partial [Oscillospiraceae bacterium]|nr:hypothetical protein [Oscillospiraceae bacterium]
QHNLPALNSHRQLGINNSATSKNLEKLSSGFKINRAGDDAAGLAISEKMRGQIRGLGMAEQNASNGVSLIQTAEGGLNETHAILQRMRELSVQSANGTYQDEDRLQIDKEMQALKSEIDRIATSTHYNGIKVLDGTTGGKYTRNTATGALDVTNTIRSATNGFGTGFDIEIKSGSAYTGEGPGTVSVVKRADNEYVVSVQVGDKSYTGVTDTANSIILTDGTLTLKRNGDGAGFDANDILSNVKIAVDAAGDSFTVSGFVMGAQGAATKVSGTGAAAAMTSDSMYANAKSKLMFQIGANGHADQRVGTHVDNMSSGMIGSFSNTLKTNASGTINGMNIKTQEGGRDAIDVIDKAIVQVAGQRAELGALQNRLEHTLNNLGVTKENLTAAESSIRDVDMAKEMMEFQKNNILVQASQAMLAQANSLPQGVLQLLR